MYQYNRPVRRILHESGREVGHDLQERNHEKQPGFSGFVCRTIYLDNILLGRLYNLGGDRFLFGLLSLHLIAIFVDRYPYYSFQKTDRNRL